MPVTAICCLMATHNAVPHTNCVNSRIRAVMAEQACAHKHRLPQPWARAPLHRACTAVPIKALPGTHHTLAAAFHIHADVTGSSSSSDDLQDTWHCAVQLNAVTNSAAPGACLQQQERCTAPCKGMPIMRNIVSTTVSTTRQQIHIDRGCNFRSQRNSCC